MRRVRTWGPMALTVAAGGMLLGADPVAPRPFPPLPVPPVEHHAPPPFLLRITISGAPQATGVFERCVDLQADLKSARARAKARPAGAAAPLAACVNVSEARPGGSIHHELSCDRAKGAKSSFRMVSDGTWTDLRMHLERYDIDPASGVRKTTTSDSRAVSLGPCPADLAPGQVRRVGGPILGGVEARRVLAAAGGAAP